MWLLSDRLFKKMSFLDHFLCCSFLLAAGFLAVYLLIGYLIAFAFELLWLLESSTSLPAAAVLLCAGYFCLALFCALLLHGLATKNNICLVAWMFAVTVLTFPEAGLVIYMSIQYWRIESLYGITELACWLARIIANVIQLVIVHLLYSGWREEEMVAKRLRDLSLTAVTIPRDHNLVNSQYYQNNGYDTGSEQHLDAAGMKRSTSTPHIWTGTVPNNMAVPQPIPPFPLDAYHQICTTQSEFNASVFVPNLYSDMQMDLSAIKKSQSLVDLRAMDLAHHITTTDKQWQPWMTESSTNVPYTNYSLSLDRRSHTKLPKFASMDELNPQDSSSGPIIRNRTGFYAQPIENFGVPIYYGPLDGPDFLIYKKQIDKLSSKNSLSNTSTDDVQKYRDVAL